MARDFSQNSNRSLRVVGGALRRPLVSVGLGLEQFKKTGKSTLVREEMLRKRIERGETLNCILSDPCLSQGFKDFAKTRISASDRSNSPPQPGRAERCEFGRHSALRR